jgi:CelD/BcsL family acetyltransferase involved in cellulose biosynthesis
MSLDISEPDIKEHLLPQKDGAKTRIISIDPVTDKRWDKFISHHPKGSIFHHSAWSRVLQERYNTKPNYYALEDSRGEITGVLPLFLIAGTLGGRRLVSLPCSEYCYPLAYNPEDIERLVSRAKEDVKTKHLSFLEIRGSGNEIDEDRLALQKHSYYLNHVTTLTENPKELKTHLSRETRYHINRGERSGVTIRLASNEEDLKSYHQLTCAMRKRINLLPWPYRFLRSIYQHLILPGYGFLMLAEANNKIVSGGIFLCHKDTVLNKFNASDPKFIQLRTNYLLMWKAIEYSCERSFHYFDFGITNPENLGLTKFKRHWDSQESILKYYYYPRISGFNSTPETSTIYRMHTVINKFLPDFVLKLTAEIFYKRLG